MKNRVLLKELLHPVLPEPYSGGSLGLKDPVTEQSDLGMGYRDPESSLGQDPCRKVIFLYSTEGLLPFGSFLMGLAARKPVMEGRIGDAEFLGDAPDRPLALVVLLQGILDILLQIAHFDSGTR